MREYFDEHQFASMCIGKKNKYSLARVTAAKFQNHDSLTTQYGNVKYQDQVIHNTEMLLNLFSLYTLDKLASLEATLVLNSYGPTECATDQ